MADIKYSQLGAATTITDTDVIPMVNMSADPIETNKITAAKVKEYAIGNTNISSIGDGTPTGAIAALKSGKTEATAVSEYIEIIGATAQGDYTIGKTFLATNGKYYKATAAITGGTTTLVEETNCEETTVGDEITSLNEALTNEVSARAELGAHNLVLFPYSVMSGSSGGVQYSVDKDGVISTNTGISSGASYFNFCQGRLLDQFALNVGESYILSGGIDNNKTLVLYFSDSNNTIIGDAFTSKGDEVQFTVPTGAYYVNMNLYIRNGTSVANDKFYPMIRLASDPNTTYQPYAMTNRELTEARFLNGTLGTMVANNFTNTAEYTIPNDGWYYLYLQTNVATSGSSLRIMLGSDYSGNVVAQHRNSNIQYEGVPVNLPLKKGTKVVFKCSDTSVSCQYQVTPIT